MLSKKLPQVIIAVFFLMILGILSYRSFTSKELYCIDINRTFESFDMKNELQAQYLAKSRAIQSALDSIAMNYESLNEKERTELLGMQLYKQLQDLTKQKQQLESVELVEADRQVQMRLNEYLKEFSLESEIHYLIGYTESYPIIHVDSSFDITDHAILFINKRYKGIE